MYKKVYLHIDQDFERCFRPVMEKPLGDLKTFQLPISQNRIILAPKNWNVTEIVLYTV